MRDNVLFLKIRRCPCCNLTNACPNPITQGPLSIEQYATVIWAFGSSTSPSGRLDKICFYVWTAGGFAATYQDLNVFLDARRESPQIMKEWQAAYQICVKHFEDGVIRITKKGEAELGSKMAAARNTVVDAFKIDQKRVAAPYRGVLRSKFEKKHPGKIDKDGLPTKMIKTEKGVVEVVLALM